MRNRRPLLLQRSIERAVLPCMPQPTEIPHLRPDQRRTTLTTAGHRALANHKFRIPNHPCAVRECSREERDLDLASPIVEREEKHAFSRALRRRLKGSANSGDPNTQTGRDVPDCRGRSNPKDIQEWRIELHQMSTEVDTGRPKLLANTCRGGLSWKIVRPYVLRKRQHRLHTRSLVADRRVPSIRSAAPTHRPGLFDHEAECPTIRSATRLADPSKLVERTGTDQRTHPVTTDPDPVTKFKNRLERSRIEKAIDFIA